MRSFRPALVLTALALVGGGCGGKALGSEPSGRGIRAATSSDISVIPGAERDFRPSFSGKAMDGARISSKDLAGHVAVVNFWASWCGPCRAEQPILQSAWERYAPRGVKFLGVDVRDSSADAKAHLEEFGVTYPSVFNPDSSISYAFRVSFIPTTYILDRDGRVAAKLTGPARDLADLGRVIDQELAS